MQTAIEACHLDLSSLVVFTEAASGAYVVTPLLAAMANAKQVFALAHTTAHGTVEEITSQTFDLARYAGVASRIEIITAKSAEIVSRADIITNSGHVRPIDAEMVSWMKPTAVIPLMYESWELRPKDVDLRACRQRQIAVAGTNECHDNVDVFVHLGSMGLKLLFDAGVDARRSRVLVLCDNPFAPFIVHGLTSAGAEVELADNLSFTNNKVKDRDAIVVALKPGPVPVVGPDEADKIAVVYPGAVVVQFWGDLDRRALMLADVPFWPIEAPSPGHMGILPSAVGPVPIIKLQVGGLKVGEIMALSRRSMSGQESADAAAAAAVSSGFGQWVRY